MKRFACLTYVYLIEIHGDNLKQHVLVEIAVCENLIFRLTAVVFPLKIVASTIAS